MGEFGPGACVSFLVGGTGTCPLVGETGSCHSDGQGHVKGCVYWQLSAQDDFRQPVCWWVGLCSNLPAGCWVGPDLGAKMATSRRIHADEHSPAHLPPVSLPAALLIADSSEDSQVGLAQASIGSLLCPRSQSESLCEPLKSRISVSFSPVELLHSSLAYFKAKCSWGSSFQCQTFRLGSLTWGSELSLLWEILSNIIILQFVDHPLGKYGIWLYHKSTPVPSCVASSLGWNVFFGRFESFFVSGCSAVGCDFGGIMREGELKSFYLPSCLQLWQFFKLSAACLYTYLNIV